MLAWFWMRCSAGGTSSRTSPGRSRTLSGATPSSFRLRSSTSSGIAKTERLFRPTRFRDLSVSVLASAILTKTRVGLGSQSRSRLASCRAHEGRQYAKTGTSPNLYDVTSPSGASFTPPPGRCWARAKPGFEQLDADGRIWWGPKGDRGAGVSRCFWKRLMTACCQRRFGQAAKTTASIRMALGQLRDIGLDVSDTEAGASNPTDPGDRHQTLVIWCSIRSSVGNHGGQLHTRWGGTGSALRWVSMRLPTARLVCNR